MPPKPKSKTPTAAVQRLPVLPLKDAVIFPRMVVPLMVGRPGSLAAVEESLALDTPIFLLTQLDPAADEPTPSDLFRVGVAASILQTLRMPDGTMKVVVEGIGRGKVQRFYLDQDVPEVVVRKLPVTEEATPALAGLMRAVFTQFEEYSRLTQRIAPEILSMIQGISEPELFADSVCAYLSLKMIERQGLLEIDNVSKRLERMAELLMRENELMGIEQHVRDRVREQMERGQREHYLQEQLKAIHQELGSREEGMDEFSEMRELIRKAKMPKEAREKAEREFARYERMPPMSPESTVIRTYLEWLCDVPWTKRSKDAIDLEKAHVVLDEDHFGLKKVKERILEFLAVRKLNPKTKGPILCLVGPPGVGKTSLGQSIARAMNRGFVRVSLGGVRDEAEIRGHRRTYIGALPGRVIQSMKKAGVKNPVFMLDEIDKMNVDFRGDPSSALLEVLDPAQNKAFSDHYMEVDYDLSEVFFIATANNEFDIPYALHDRMEVVRLPGYTLTEKEQIARRFLLPRQREACGLDEKQLEITPAGLDGLIQSYTREAGVRELDRQIANLGRKVARRRVEDPKGAQATLGMDDIMAMLGPPPFSPIHAELQPQVGVAVGLAWTQSGGDVLTIETSTMRGRGALQLTGQLGDVMKESAQAAYTFLRANAASLGIPENFNKTTDLHIHVPEGGIPKDGPSAGISLMTSMLSALRGEAPQGALAMTGEITLRGRVLPVGGIKEKVLAAHRAGVKRVLLPKENEKDFPDIPEEVHRDLTIQWVSQAQEVIAAAFPGVLPDKT